MQALIKQAEAYLKAASSQPDYAIAVLKVGIGCKDLCYLQQGGLQPERRFVNCKRQSD